MLSLITANKQLLNIRNSFKERRRFIGYAQQTQLIEKMIGS